MNFAPNVIVIKVMAYKQVKNAFLAESYIIVVASLIRYAGKALPGEDSFVAPIAALSLFVLSAAIMGYLFCYEPIALLLKGEKDAAIALFGRTVATFAAITVMVWGFLFWYELRRV